MVCRRQPPRPTIYRRDSPKVSRPAVGFRPLSRLLRPRRRPKRPRTSLPRQLLRHRLPPRPPQSPVTPHPHLRPPLPRHPGADDRRRAAARKPRRIRLRHTQGRPATPTVSASGCRRRRIVAPPAATAGISATGVPPSVLAASGIAATGTGAAIVSSETEDQHLDDAIGLAFELLHASRMYPGLHWCVGIFKVATGTETVIVSNDGASYIPPGVYVPRSARVLFADPELGAGFQAKCFGWVNPTATMVAYAAERAVLDPERRAARSRRHHRPRRLVRTARPPRRCASLSGLRLDPLADRCRDARPGTRREQTASPRRDVSAELRTTQRRQPASDRTAVRRPGRRPLVPSRPHSPAPSPFTSKSRPSSARSSADSPAAHRSPTTNGPRSRKCVCTASRCSCGPGFIEVEPSGDPNTTVLYRAHHNLDRAVEALSLWRGDNPDHADIVYATEQVTKEGQLWPVRT